MPQSPTPRPKRPWQEVAREAQEYRDATMKDYETSLPEPLKSNMPNSVMNIPGSLLGGDDLRITELLPEELVSLLASGQLSSVAVTESFLRRAALAQKLANCVTELLPERALTRAKFLDDHYARYKKPIGPLHGLPISVKEHIGMDGLRVHCGYVSWWYKIGKEDAHVLEILWNAGAVFHARTTEPQSMMHLETDSNLYGVTVNPYNRDVTSGGSSGGEGALIALRGSCLGIGSDVGGSIRNPAANNGIYGFKPTAFRIPTDGWGYAMAGADTIDSVPGPLSTSLSGIKLFMKAVLDARPWLTEPAIVPISWDSNLALTDRQPLKVAVMWHDGVVKPHPPVTRALSSVVEKLRSLSNVTIVDWKPHLHDEAWAIISNLYYPDGGEEDAAAIDSSGEPWRPLTKWIIKENPCVKELTRGELNYWLEEREAYRKEYANAWTATATGGNSATGDLGGMVDIILCPVGPGVAPEHGTAKYWCYTSQWNLLNYPAVVFPVSKVDAGVDVKDGAYEPKRGVDRDNWDLYDPHKFDGLPISLQLVGRRYEDEKVLAILEYIKEKIGLPFAKFP
ncbi:amidase [Mytilinidion resinicola]|uniref:amidase n=1 Tax=Mytilinidion resinicola TaxID=574789 RepID=A0A6A6YQJ0_9PEZI|nr:amidase [Mytilinidion resinicola]KAF2811031.1 amidase [Mytilinidion resinicola]